MRKLDIVDAARMFAAVDMSFADAESRSGTRSTSTASGDPSLPSNWPTPTATRRRPPTRTWAPLRPTPPYPDYVSGYSGGIGAFTRALQDTLDTRHLHLTFTSTAVRADVKRKYDSGRKARQDVVDARVWLGYHFRTADTRGARMGQQVAEWALDHYFRPAGHH